MRGLTSLISQKLKVCASALFLFSPPSWGQQDLVPIAETTKRHLVELLLMRVCSPHYKELSKRNLIPYKSNSASLKSLRHHTKSKKGRHTT